MARRSEARRQGNVAARSLGVTLSALDGLFVRVERAGTTNCVWILLVGFS